MLLSCQSDEERLIGHWHNLDATEKSSYSTLDFIDSTIIIDKNNISQKGEGLYQFYHDTIFFSIYSHPYCTKYRFIGDTLILDDERWVKVGNDSKDSLVDFYSSLKLNVELEKLDSTISMSASTNINGNISFGKCKEEYDGKNDSFCLQINHSLSGFDSITGYLNAMKEAWEGENRNFSIQLTIDKNTPNG